MTYQKKKKDCLDFKFGLASTLHVWCVREKQTETDQTKIIRKTKSYERTYMCELPFLTKFKTYVAWSYFVCALYNVYTFFTKSAINQFINLTIH